MHFLRFLLPLAMVALSATPSHAGWLDQTVNDSIEQVGRATVSPQSLSRTPDQVVRSLSTQISSTTSITPEAARSLLDDLKGLDRDRLETVAANVSTCIIVDCRGVPADKVASLADRIVGALQDAANEQSALWTRGVAILSVIVTLLSLIANVLLTLSNRRTKPA